MVQNKEFKIHTRLTGIKKLSTFALVKNVSLLDYCSAAVSSSWEWSYSGASGSGVTFTIPKSTNIWNALSLGSMIAVAILHTSADSLFITISSFPFPSPFWISSISSAFCSMMVSSAFDTCIVKEKGER